MGERASSRSDIAALKPRFRQISYASGVFFTLAMHRRLLTNFFLGRFHLGLGPSLHLLSPQQPHFLDNPLFDRVGLLVERSEPFGKYCLKRPLVCLRVAALQERINLAALFAGQMEFVEAAFPRVI